MESNKDIQITSNENSDAIKLSITNPSEYVKLEELPSIQSEPRDVADDRTFNFIEAPRLNRNNFELMIETPKSLKSTKSALFMSGPSKSVKFTKMKSQVLRSDLNSFDDFSVSNDSPIVENLTLTPMNNHHKQEEDHSSFQIPNYKVDALKNSCQKTDENIFLASAIPVFPEFTYDYLLLVCGICICSYVGVLIRIGFQAFRLNGGDTNYTILWCNIIGCILFGFIRQHSLALSQLSNSRFHKMMYLLLTSPLMGSITTFSSWAFECYKNLFLEYHSEGIYNASRCAEWLVSLWTGIVLGIASLHLGYHIGYLSPLSNTIIEAFGVTDIKKDFASESYIELKQYLSRFSISEINPWKERALIIMFVITTVIVIVIPVMMKYSYAYISMSCALGCIGSFIRYQLSVLNIKYKEFPLGTFLANMIGTWILALALSLSVTVVDYNDIQTQELFYAIIVGFCGCLTTMSTFVNELDMLALKDSYIYGLATIFGGQLGLFLVYGLVLETMITNVAPKLDPVNFCKSYEELCSYALDTYNCPLANRNIVSCSDISSIATYVGICQCDGFNSLNSEISQLLLSAQIKSDVSNRLVRVFPIKDLEFIINHSYDPSLVVDNCLSYEVMCDYALDRVNCPQSYRIVNSCNRLGIDNFIGTCSCNHQFNIPSINIEKEIMSNLLKNYDNSVINYPYPILRRYNLCQSYVNECNALLEYIQCPSKSKAINACSNDFNYTSWNAICTCDDFNIGSDLLLSIITNNILSPVAMNLLVTSNNTSIIDFPKSYINFCQEFLDVIECPSHLRQVSNFANITILSNFHGKCGCSLYLSNTISNKIASNVIEATLEYITSTNYTFILPKNYYLQAITSNSFLQLIWPERKAPSYRYINYR